MSSIHNPSSISHNLAARYTFASKERDEESGLSYFGARYYSSDLSIWLAVDPMSDKYPSLSPYVYCANNPVKCVDPNGEEIDPESLSLWKSMKTLLLWEKKINTINVQLEKKSKGLLCRGAMMKDMSIDKTLGTMKNMEGSSQLYKLNSQNGNVSSTCFDPLDNSITINFTGNGGFIHELTHCAQFERGDIAFNAAGGCSALTDVDDELEAYQNQISYDPKSAPVNPCRLLTVDWLRNIYDGDRYPYQDCGLYPINRNSNADDMNKAFGNTFVFKGKLSNLPELYFKSN